MVVVPVRYYSESYALSPRAVEDHDVEYSFCGAVGYLVRPVKTLNEEASGRMTRASAGQASTHGSPRTLAAVKASV